MATLKAMIFEHHKKPDGSFPIKIRITQNRQSAYLDTGIFVDAKNIDSKGEIKKKYIETVMYRIIPKVLGKDF